MRTTRRRFIHAASGLLAPAILRRRSLRAEPMAPGPQPLALGADRDGIVYLPRGYAPGQPRPLLVLFHGAGGTGRSVSYAFQFADQHGVIILAPDSRDQRSWDLIVGAYGPDADFLAAALRQTLRRHDVDRQRLWVGGHSDGASYALSFGIGAGDLFTRILAFSPGVMTPIEARGKPRFFVSHGTRDAVMPIDDTSRRFVPRLRALGYDVTYQEYDGGHAVPDTVVGSGLAWAAGQGSIAPAARTGGGRPGQ